MPKNRFSTIIVLLLSLVTLTSCASKPAFKLPNFLSPKTPTPTATATPTPLPVYKTFTPTFTPDATDTPTPTPTPPVNLNPCAFAAECPQAINILEFVEDEVLSGSQHEVEVPFNTPLYFHYRWTAIDEETLEDNMKAMSFFFNVDGQSYLLEEDIATGVVEDAGDPSVLLPAVAFGYILDGWEIGEPHVVHIGFTFLDEVFDGWDTYPAGTVFEVTYIINPVPPPTSTPTATASNTPKPQPTAVPATVTPACELDTSIVIKNDTGGQVTMYFTGPAKYTFYIAPGTQTLTLCSGEYSYTAYGCGNASTSGTAGAGDEIEFWCE